MDGHGLRDVSTQHVSDVDRHAWSVVRSSGTGNYIALMRACVVDVHPPGQLKIGAHSHLAAKEHRCTGFTDAVTLGACYSPPFHALSLALRTHGVSFDINVWVRHILGHARYVQEKLRHVSPPLGQAEGKSVRAEMLAGICCGNDMHPRGQVNFGALSYTRHALSIAKRTGTVTFDTDVWLKRTQCFRDIQEGRGMSLLHICTMCTCVRLS